MSKVGESYKRTKDELITEKDFHERNLRKLVCRLEILQIEAKEKEEEIKRKNSYIKFLDDKLKEVGD